MRSFVYVEVWRRLRVWAMSYVEKKETVLLILCQSACRWTRARLEVGNIFWLFSNFFFFASYQREGHSVKPQTPNVRAYNASLCNNNSRAARDPPQPVIVFWLGAIVLFYFRSPLAESSPARRIIIGKFAREIGSLCHTINNVIRSYRGGGYTWRRRRRGSICGAPEFDASCINSCIYYNTYYMCSIT